MSLSYPELEFGPITTAVVFGIVQAIFIIYFFSSKKKFPRQRFMVYLIGILLFMQIESFFLQSGYMSKFPHVFTISVPFIFLLGPFLYLYTKSQLNQVSLKLGVLHFIPFILYFFYSFNFFLQPGEFKRFLYENEFRSGFGPQIINPSFSPDPWDLQGWVVVELLSAHILIYGIISILSIRKNQREKVSLDKPRIHWLYYVTVILILGAFVLFFSQGGIIDGYVFFKSPFPHYSADLFSVIAMYLITFYLLSKTDLFKFPNKKYSKSSLSDFYKKEKLKKIIALIENDELYLDSNFCLKMLSEKSQLSQHKISQILNEELQTSFIDLTNKYRIEEAKKRLLSSEFDSKIEQLAYELGYKSKSTFFTAFKKSTNSTPSAYRKKGLL